jgi:hypothetical protein
MVNRLSRLDRVVVLLGLNDMLYDQRIHLGDIKLPPDWDMRQAFMFVPSDTWYQRTGLFQLASRLRTAMFLGKAEVSKIQIVDFGEINFKYRQRRAAVMDEDWITTVPDLRENLERFRKNLDGMVALAKARSVALTFITQPALWKPVMPDAEKSLLYAGGVAPTDQWSTNARIKWYAVEPMRMMLEAYNDATRGICNEHKLLCIDLARLLPSEAANYFDDFHFSRAGASEVGRIVARHLAPGC